MKDFEQIKGQRIKQLNIMEDTLFITTNEGVHKFVVYGDCCSNSYFHEVMNVNQMLTWIVKDIERLDLPNVTDDDSGLVQAYGYKVHTEGGYGLIVFRNESNGYYGGYMEYKGVFDTSKIDGKNLKDDWTA